METGILPEPSVNTTSPSSIANAAASSLIEGCSPWAIEYSSMYRPMSRAVFFIARETLMLPSSRKNRLISPAIMGTA